jgi:L-rhamnose mutarotase
MSAMCISSASRHVILTITPPKKDSIFFDNDRTLFAVFDYVGTDFEADMKLMKANPKVQEWWTITDEMQVRKRIII